MIAVNRGNFLNYLEFLMLFKNKLIDIKKVKDRVRVFFLAFKFYFTVVPKIEKYINILNMDLEYANKNDIDELEKISFMLDDFLDMNREVLDSKDIFTELFLHKKLDLLHTKVINTVVKISNKMVDIKIDENRKNTSI